VTIFFSKIEEDKALFSIVTKDNVSTYRTDMCPEEEFLQVSGRMLKSGTEVKAHRHLPVSRQTDITQEAWIIFSGKIEVTIFDLDDSEYVCTTLWPGDCVVFFRGGHSLKVLEENTLMYEFKTGPYFGADKDKEDI